MNANMGLPVPGLQIFKQLDPYNTGRIDYLSWTKQVRLLGLRVCWMVVVVLLLRTRAAGVHGRKEPGAG